MTDDSTLKAAHAEIRRKKVQQWKQEYLKNHDFMVAPEPTDEDLHWPEPMVTVTWEHGYITMTLDAYDKLKAKGKKLFNKLGGMY